MTDRIGVDVTDRTCTKGDCDGVFYAKGMCRRHYNAESHLKHRDRPERRRARREASEKYISDASNRDAHNARTRNWRRENPEKVRAQREGWREANRERMLELRRANEAARKARIRSNTAEHVDYAAILAEHGMVCHLCQRAILDRSDLHFDHVVPLAKGGAHAASNIRPSHAACNLRKGARVIPTL